MPHACVGCGEDCDCIEGEIVARNCVGCGDCDDFDDDDADWWDDEADG